MTAVLVIALLSAEPSLEAGGCSRGVVRLGGDSGVSGNVAMDAASAVRVALRWTPR